MKFRGLKIEPNSEHPSLDHVEPVEPVDSDDPLHWTGVYFNWNSRCASCHSTDLQRGYDPATNHYATTWSEISVGCEACHGPAEDHLAWARQSDSEETPHRGLAFSLADPGIWQAVADLASGGATHPTLKRSGPSADTQKKQCASCHSRRTEIAQADPRSDYYDSHRLSLLEDPLYHADGQIRD